MTPSRPSRKAEPFRKEVRLELANMAPPRRCITRVKTFTAGWLSNLEAFLNDWLTERGPTFHLMDLKYNVTDTKAGTVYTAMAVYSDLETETEEDEEEAQ